MILVPSNGEMDSNFVGLCGYFSPHLGFRRMPLLVGRLVLDPSKGPCGFCLRFILQLVQGRCFSDVGFIIFYLWEAI